MTALKNLIAAYLAVEPETLAPAEYIAAARQEQRELIETLEQAADALSAAFVSNHWDYSVRTRIERVLLKHKEPARD